MPAPAPDPAPLAAAVMPHLASTAAKRSVSERTVSVRAAPGSMLTDWCERARRQGAVTERRRAKWRRLRCVHGARAILGARGKN